MKNKYIQSEFGQCGFVCIANAFNLPHIIPPADKCKNGLSWLNSRKLIEWNTSYTIQCLFYSVKHINYYIPVFEVDVDFKTNKDLYAIFFVTILSETPGFHHCVLVIKENHNKYVSVLDPMKKEPFRVNILEFFHYYDVTGIESVCNKDHGGTMFFEESHLSHLL